MHRLRRRSTIGALFACGLSPLLASGCAPDEPDPALSPEAQRGKAVYLNVCIACHNADPTVDGSLGPAVAGASVALLEAKVLRAEYPPGYTPKRPGSVTMPSFPYLEDQIPALRAYLASVEPQPAKPASE